MWSAYGESLWVSGESESAERWLWTGKGGGGQRPSGSKWGTSETDLRERIQDSDGFQDGYFGFIQSLALAGTSEVFTLLGSSWATQRCPTLSYKHL